VLLRYGSLTDFSTVRLGYTEVAREARMLRPTVVYILRKFVRDGHQMLNHYKGSPRRACSPAIEEYLTSKETLQRWAGMPLKWRVGQLQLEKQVACSRDVLRAVYLRHGISYRATNYMHYNGWKVTEQERREYAQRLQPIIESDKPLIYVDEASFHTWKRLNKTWAPKHEIIHLPIQNTRGEGVTVYGAIGTCLKRAVFTLGDRTTPEGFSELLEQARRQLIGRSGERIYVVADGHQAHKGKAGSAFMAANNFVYLRTPGYSPQFNS